MARECRHGIEWKSTKVWNEACVKCSAGAEQHGATLNRGHGHNLEGYRETERWRRWRAAQPDWSEVWARRRRIGIERRAEWVKQRLQEPPDLPPAVAAVVELYRDAFTEPQYRAIIYTHGYGLSQREAARALGITRDAYRKRLELAERKLKPLLDAQRRDGEWRFHEFKTPYGDGYVWKDTGEPYVEPVK